MIIIQPRRFDTDNDFDSDFDEIMVTIPQSPLLFSAKTKKEKDVQ